MVLIGFVVYTLFAPIVPATYGKPDIQNSTEIYAGQPMTYKIHTCRYVGDGVITNVVRQLVSTTDKNLAPISLSSDTTTGIARCLDVTRTLIIPFSTPKGNYQLVIKGVYSIFPLRKPITVTATSDSFDLKVKDVPQSNTTEPTTTSPVSSNPVQGNNTVIPRANSTPVANNSTTNNSTTTNNTTNNNPGSGSPAAPTGLIPDILRALVGGSLNF